jgi:hypothetical protein
LDESLAKVVGWSWWDDESGRWSGTSWVNAGIYSRMREERETGSGTTIRASMAGDHVPWTEKEGLRPRSGMAHLQEQILARMIVSDGQDEH